MTTPRYLVGTNSPPLRKGIVYFVIDETKKLWDQPMKLASGRMKEFRSFAAAQKYADKLNRDR